MCYQVLKHTHASSDSQPRQSTLHSYLYYLVWCGTAALEQRHCRDSSDHWGLGGIYTLSFPPQRFSVSSFSLQHAQNRAGALSLPPLLTSSPQANPLISLSILKGKGSKTRLESSSIDSPTLKSTWFKFWLVVVFVTLGAWLLAG